MRHLQAKHQDNLPEQAAGHDNERQQRKKTSYLQGVPKKSKDKGRTVVSNIDLPL